MTHRLLGTSMGWMSRATPWMALAIGLLAPGCSGCEERSGGAPAPKVTPAPAPTADLSPFVARARACPWPDAVALSAKTFGAACPALGEFFEVTHAKGAAFDGALVQLLEDDDVALRKLAALGLDGAESYRSDPKLAARVVAAAEKEKAMGPGQPLDFLARDVGRIHVAATALLPRVDLWLRSRPKGPSGLGSALLALVSDDAEEPEAFSLVRAYASDGGPVLRAAAIGALSSVPEKYVERRASACAAIASGLRDGDAYVREVAANGLSSYQCASFDAGR